MKHHFAFILEETEFHRDIFRFYPRNTHVHGFGDEPPKTWQGVYKVYYSWAILRQYFKDGTKEIEQTDRLIDMQCDECSRIPNLVAIIDYVDKENEIFDYPTIGQPAGDWRIEKVNIDNGYEKPYDLYKFVVFDNWLDVGYRFYLRDSRIDEFKDYLNKINQYALDHSEGI